jgi:hypothetical protein
MDSTLAVLFPLAFLKDILILRISKRPARVAVRKPEVSFMSRTGKIARLPYWLRNQLNEKIRDGKPGVEIIAWLNEKPDTRSVVNERFDGRPINEQNLTEWKAGGYLEWERQAETRDWVRDFVGESKELEGEAEDAKSYTSVGDWLAAPVAVELARCLREVRESKELTLLERVGAVLEISRATAQLRRSDLASQRQTRELLLADEEYAAQGYEDAKKQANEAFHETLVKGVFENFIEVKKADLERRETALKKRQAAKAARDAAAGQPTGEKQDLAGANGAVNQGKSNQIPVNPGVPAENQAAAQRMATMEEISPLPEESRCNPGTPNQGESGQIKPATTPAPAVEG